MSDEENNRMLPKRMRDEHRSESRPVDGWSVNDLDLAEILNTVAEAVRIGRLNEPGGREPENLLPGLGLLHEGILFRAAAALFGIADHLKCDMPQCLLRVAPFCGGGGTSGGCGRTLPFARPRDGEFQ